jgi:mannose-1-phosphate guanylyltransferase
MDSKAKKLNMKAVIFAGGIGTRLWPLSREQTPKQFEKMVNGKSTLQLTIDRLRPEFPWENIYISTGKRYKTIVKKQLPKVPNSNIVGEPVRRDLASAVGYMSAIVAKDSSDDPFVILWSDHIMENVSRFKKVLQVGGEFIAKNKNKFLFLGQKPRFANQNLGWIEMGKKTEKIEDFNIYKFKSWKYRPNIQLARQFYKSGKHVWNPGYWVVTPGFVLEQYKKFMPGMYKKLLSLQKSYGTKEHEASLEKIYPTLEKISFDDAILEKLEQDKAVVLPADFGWADVGTWQALKEVQQKSKKDNVTKGEVYLEACEDCLIHNHEGRQIVVGADLSNLVVVNTKDVLLVCSKESMKTIKKIVGRFKEDKKYKKYT